MFNVDTQGRSADLATRELAFTHYFSTVTALATLFGQWRIRPCPVQPSSALPPCEFETGRLQVSEWRSASWPERSEDDLALIVAAILAEPVTRSLPETWHGALTREQANAWIAERDIEGATLLVAEKATGKPVGVGCL